jgi:signal transduction histidine kinase
MLAEPMCLRLPIMELLLCAVGLGAMPVTAQQGSSQQPEATNSIIESSPGWDSSHSIGSWIWAAETHDDQSCRFWKSFTIPKGASIKEARLRITADNSYTVALDGQSFGYGSEWRNVKEYDLTALLKPGPHVLTVSAYNDFDVAGVVAGLQIKLAGGKELQIGTDASWRVVPISERTWEQKIQANPEWKTAKVIAPFSNSRTWSITVNNGTVMNPPVLPVVEPFWREAWFQIALVLTCVVFFILSIYLVIRLMLQSHRQTVVKRERARFAMDLHDGLTGGLNRLVLLAETARNELPPESERWQHLTQVCEHTRGLIRTANETIWLINSQRDTLKDFAAYIAKYAETFFQPTSIRCRFDIEPELPELECDVGRRRNWFLAVKEALNNVLRHSGATEVRLTMKLRGDSLLIHIEDNGQGFDTASASEQGNGLRNMRNRARYAGGECCIVSETGNGCRVELAMPVHPSRWWLFNRRAEESPLTTNPN